MPKKMRRGALRSALSERVREGNLVVVDGFTLGLPKTKEFLRSLVGLGLDGKTLIVDSLDNVNLWLAARNVKRAKVVNSHSLNIYDLLYHEKLVLSRAAAEELNQLLDPQRPKGAVNDSENSGADKGNAEEEAA
jgi:large subunit ribosomal protein L4